MPFQKFRQFDEFFREFNQIHTKFHQSDEFFREFDQIHNKLPYFCMNYLSI